VQRRMTSKQLSISATIARCNGGDPLEQFGVSDPSEKIGRKSKQRPCKVSQEHSDNDIESLDTTQTVGNSGFRVEIVVRGEFHIRDVPFLPH
jgi:hypothetical protein